MKRIFAFSMIGFILATMSGCVFDSDEGKSEVKKGSVSGSVKMTVTNSPLTGVKVYLVNTAVKADTVNYANNSKALVDSAVTDSEGRYAFGNIAPGRYGVVPVNGDSTGVYRFSGAAASDSSMFSMNGNSFSVNFFAEKLDAPGSSSRLFWDTVYYKNGTVSSVHCARRHWLVFIPYLREDRDLTVLANSTGQQYTTIGYEVGITMIGWTRDNCHFYDVVYDGSKKRSFCIYYSLFTLPDGRSYTYDLSTGKLSSI